jgi:type IV secretory pathway TrbL component
MGECHSDGEAGVIDTLLNLRNLLYFHVLMMILIVMSLVLEFGMHALDRVLRQRKYYAAMVAKLLRELVVIGLLNFLLFLAGVSGSREKCSSSRTPCFSR